MQARFFGWSEVAAPVPVKRKVDMPDGPFITGFLFSLCSLLLCLVFGRRFWRMVAPLLLVVMVHGSGTTLGPTNWYDVITTTVTYTFDGTTVTWNVANSAPGYTGGGNYDVSINGVTVANYNPGGPSGPYNSTQTGSHAANVGDSIAAISNLYFAWTITAATDSHVLIAIPANEGLMPVEYAVMQGGVQIGSTITSAPGEGAKAGSFPTDSTAGPVTVVKRVAGIELSDNGTWETNSGAVVTGTLKTGLTPTAGSTPGSGETPTPLDPDPNPTPDGPVDPTKKGVWTPSAGAGGTDGLLTITAYREGVDMMLAELKGKTQTQVLAPSSGTNAITLTNNSTLATKTFGKLPVAPTLSNPGSSSTITISFEIPKLTGGAFTVNKTIDFSASPYAAPIAVFRGLLLILCTVAFFFATFWVVRGAFVSK